MNISTQIRFSASFVNKVMSVGLPNYRNLSLSIIGVLFAFVSATQTTVQLGTIVSTSHTNSFAPVHYQWGATSKCARSNVLWAQDELNTAGIPNGAIITAVEFDKYGDPGYDPIFIIPADFKMYMANTNNASLIVGTAWSSVLSDHSLVYSNSSFNFPDPGYGWIKWDITPFTYTGGALEIAFDLKHNGPGNATFGNVAGSFEWYVGNNPYSAGKVIGQRDTIPPLLLTSTNIGFLRKPVIKITYVTTLPCSAPGIPIVTNIGSNSATISWNTVSGALGYQYGVTTDSLVPASGTDTTATTINVNGLLGATTYYVHLRAKCGPTSFSSWVRKSFTTGCQAPPTASITLSSTGTIDANWNAVNAAIGYQYGIMTTITPPSLATNATTTNIHMNDLSSGAAYYLYVRTDCGAGAFSPWTITAFNTPCFKPSPRIVANETPGHATISWNNVSGATAYEYAILTTIMPPSGSSMAVTTDTVVNLTGLRPGLKNYFHIRSHCQGNALSEWSTLEFHSGGIEVNPNPVTSIVQITVFGVSPNGSGELEMYDSQGKLIRRLKLTANAVNLDMSVLPAGVYLIKYRGASDSNHDYQTRILKQ